ncbi:MAG: hypothetical protein JSV86_11925 [Gemmatimonadota bacterium]|nr:MAG: hypothetical protein JSV86_11925 [Gemmatimonadota bacterium]
MKWTTRYRRVEFAALTVTTLATGGCIEYRIEATLNPDGSGVRTEQMVVGRTDELSVRVSTEQFGQLMHVTERDGWTYSREVEDDDTLHVLRRETRVSDLAAWADLSGDVLMTASTAVGVEASVGHVSLRDVQFMNAVRVETGRSPAGSSFTYRETFYWENLMDAIIEYLALRFRATLDARYPDLSAEQRGEVVGLMRGGLWAAMDQGLFDAGGDEEEAIVSAFIDGTAEQAAKIVRRRYPDAEEEFFRNVLRQLYEDENDQLGTFLEEELPGVQLAANSEIVFRLNMPGRVIVSNAHERDGNTLVWEFGPADATTAPVEVFAESVVER